MRHTILVSNCVSNHRYLAPVGLIIWIRILFFTTFQMLGQGSDPNENWDSRFFPSGFPELNNAIITLKVSSKDELYVGGNFRNIGENNPHNSIAKWDGKKWQSVGARFNENAVVRDIIIDGDFLYAAGLFSMSGETPLRNHAKFEGANWLDIGGGASGTIHTIAKVGSDLYVGGLFTNAGEIAASNIARRERSRN